MANSKHANKFSYSKLNTYDNCPFHFYLQYDQGNFFYTESLASELGTTLHHCEEMIARSIINHEPVDYEKLKDELLNINVPKKSTFDTEGGIFGVNILKKKYPEEFLKVNNEGKSYLTKVENYLNKGIYRLEKWLNDHPGWTVYGVEHFFSIGYKGHTLSGFIDRILYNPTTGEYIIEDLKTKDKPFRDEDLVTPLQFVVYVKALSESLNISMDKIKCEYNLPFCDLIQSAGTTNFMDRGLKKLDQIFNKINQQDWTPKPSPLCYWCTFSKTNPTAPAEGKHLCPFYSLWTQGGNHRVWEVDHKWKNLDDYKELIKQIKQEEKDLENIDIDF